MRINLILLCGVLFSCNSFNSKSINEKLSGEWSLVEKKNTPMSGDLVLHSNGTYNYNIVSNGTMLRQSGKWSASGAELRLLMLRIANSQGEMVSVRNEVLISIKELNPKELTLVFGKNSEYNSEFLRK